MQNIGKKIKNFRKRSGLSQLQLEVLINTSPGSISRIENGLVNPSKETIEKIIVALQLSPLEAADLYHIDLDSEFNKYIDIVTELNARVDLETTLKSITADLIKYVDGKYAVIFLENLQDNMLEVASLNVPEIIKTVCGNYIGHDLDKVKLSLDNTKNAYVKSFIYDEYTVTDSVYEVSYPLLDKTTAKIAQKFAAVRLIVSIPIKHNGRKLGILGIVTNKNNITEIDKKRILNFNSLISSTIYRFLKNNYE